MFHRLRKQCTSLFCNQVLMLLTGLLICAFIAVYFMSGSLITSADLILRSFSLLIGVDPNTVNVAEHSPELVTLFPSLNNLIIQPWKVDPKAASYANMVGAIGLIGASGLNFFLSMVHLGLIGQFKKIVKKGTANINKLQHNNLPELDWKPYTKKLVMLTLLGWLIVIIPLIMLIYTHRLLKKINQAQNEYNQLVNKNFQNQNNVPAQQII